MSKRAEPQISSSRTADSRLAPSKDGAPADIGADPEWEAIQRCVEEYSRQHDTFGNDPKPPIAVRPPNWTTTDWFTSASAPARSNVRNVRIVMAVSCVMIAALAFGLVVAIWGTDVQADAAAPKAQPPIVEERPMPANAGSTASPHPPTHLEASAIVSSEPNVRAGNTDAVGPVRAARTVPVAARGTHRDPSARRKRASSANAPSVPAAPSAEPAQTPSRAVAKERAF